LVPVGVDPSRASIARVYDAFLGGKNNYAIDRETMNKVLSVAPESRDLATENRTFLHRVARFMVKQTPIRQIIDCGSGLPTAENTHQVVQREVRDVRVVYVDNDPVVLAHGRALLEENDDTHIVDADIFHPRDVLENEVVRRHIDFSEPIGLLQMGTLHHLHGDGGPAIMAEYIDALPSGSYVGLSHFYDPGTPELSGLARKMEDVFVHSPMGSGAFRTEAEIMAMMDGLTIVKPSPVKDPGLALCANWWPDGPQLMALSPAAQCIAGVVGYKP
jgi:hypothetical protein